MASSSDYLYYYYFYHLYLSVSPQTHQQHTTDAYIVTAQDYEVSVWREPPRHLRSRYIRPPPVTRWCDDVTHPPLHLLVPTVTTRPLCPLVHTEEKKYWRSKFEIYCEVSWLDCAGSVFFLLGFFLII